MLQSIEHFKQVLKANNCSITQARLKVFQALLGQEPLAMHEVVERARGVDRASVYRAVDLFERFGIAQRLNTGWKYKIELSDMFSDHHHHITCLACGRTVVLSEDALEAFIEALASKSGFAAHSHQVEIQGLCRACQKEKTMVN